MNHSKIIKLLVCSLVLVLGVIFISRTNHKDSAGNTEDRFTTVTGQINGHDYVDLGLSVKWATCNVGASKPEDYGEYYAWGETESKSYYSWPTYKYCNGSSKKLTKYCDDSSFGNNGFTDTKTTLDPEDDVAHVAWGGSWRMPTESELFELSKPDNCTWKWITWNGINGYLVTSKKSGFEGASIFLPAAGYRLDNDLCDVGSFGHYWSSSHYTVIPRDAWYLGFVSDDIDAYGYFRYYGQSVRPVCP